MGRKLPKDVELKREIREAQKVARDLGYDSKLIDNFKNAQNIIQLDNMLIAARRKAGA